MSRAFVADASVLLKVFLPEEGSKEAYKLFAREHRCCFAPTLLIEEMINTLWKKLQRADVDLESAQEILHHLPALVDEWGDALSLRAQALQIAHRLSHPAYDCYYVALAVRHACPLVTADERLLRALEGSPWSEFACALQANLP